MSPNNLIEKTVSYTVSDDAIYLLQIKSMPSRICKRSLFLPIICVCSFNFIRCFYSCRLLHMHGVTSQTQCVWLLANQAIGYSTIVQLKRRQLIRSFHFAYVVSIIGGRQNLLCKFFLSLTFERRPSDLQVEDAHISGSTFRA
jgi:hypothetical protein